MLLAEPPPSQGDVHFTLFGFPVRINPWFWLMSLLMGINLQEPVLVCMWVAAVLLCILLHELGHAVVMQNYGFRPSIVLYSFGGLAIPNPGPYTGRRAGPWGQILISFAGPASGFILAVVLVAGLHYLGGCRVEIFDPTWRDVVPRVQVSNPYLEIFLFFVLEISVMWGLFNLLPVYPLDGGQIALQIFHLLNPQDALRQSLILSVIVAGMMGAIAGLQWHSMYLTIFFLWMCYSNYTMLQSLHH